MAGLQGLQATLGQLGLGNFTNAMTTGLAANTAQQTQSTMTGTGYLPAYSTSLFNSIEQYTSKARDAQRGNLTGQLALATSRLKGIPGAEQIMKDLSNTSGLVSGFGINTGGGVLAQTQRAFGVDPTALFGGFNANSINPYTDQGLNGLLGQLGPGGNLGIGLNGLLEQFGLGQNLGTNLTNLTDPVAQAFLKTIQDSGLNVNDVVRNNPELLKALGIQLPTTGATTIIKQPTTSTVAQVGDKTIVTRGSGDPHFYVDNKLMFDFQGEGGKTFNIFSDGQQAGQELIINARFDGDKDITIMGKAGIQVAGKQFTIDKNGEVTMDGKPMDKNNHEWNTTIPGKKAGEVLKATAVMSKDKDGKTVLTINSGEYQVKGIIDPTGLRFDIQNTEAGIAANGETAQGIQGEILDPAHQQKIKDFQAGKAKFKTGKGAQGEGFLDHKMDDYVVKDLFDTHFKYQAKKTEQKFGVQLEKKAGGA